MNDIFSRTLAAAQSVAGDAIIEDYVIGIGMTAVKLSNGSCGVAHIFREEIPQGCSLFDSLIETPISFRAFASDTDPFHPITSSLLLAACNAVISMTLVSEYQNSINPLDLLRITQDDIVGFVGDFRPLTASLEGKVREIRIFERHLDESYTPDWAIPFKLPQCSCVVVTATAIMNRTVDTILEHCTTNRVVVMGPSTPMDLKLFPEKVLAIGGARIVEAEKAMEIAARAGGTKNLYSSGAAKKITLVREGDIVDKP